MHNQHCPINLVSSKYWRTTRRNHQAWAMIGVDSGQAWRMIIQSRWQSVSGQAWKMIIQSLQESVSDQAWRTMPQCGPQTCFANRGSDTRGRLTLPGATHTGCCAALLTNPQHRRRRRAVSGRAIAELSLAAAFQHRAKRSLGSFRPAEAAK